jgi:hypothetical protein
VLEGQEELRETDAGKYLYRILKLHFWGNHMLLAPAVIYTFSKKII